LSFHQGAELLTLVTNGYMTDKIAAVCENCSSDGGARLALQISLDGPRPVQDRIRGLEVVFDKR